MAKKFSKNISQIQTKETGWLKNHPVSFFLLSFSLLLIAFYSVLHTNIFKNLINEPLITLNARLSAIILNWFGQGTKSIGDTIYSNTISMSVHLGCDAMEPIVLFVSAIIAFPSTINSKFKGIFLGVVFLFSVNLLRIVSLFLLQHYKPEWFELFHGMIWQVIFIALAIGCCGYWIQGNNMIRADATSK